MILLFFLILFVDYAKTNTRVKRKKKERKQFKERENEEKRNKIVSLFNQMRIDLSVWLSS